MARPAPSARDVKTLSYDGRDWGLRRREAEETTLAEDHPLSAARALGGALGQAHRGQAPEPGLRAAAAGVSDALVRSTMQRIADWRKELLTLLGRP